jgi:hypothetical protein
MGLDIDGEATGDISGISVSLSSDGTRLAVGVERNDGAGTDAGHARVFEWSGAQWVQMGLDIDGEAAGDRFGIGLSLSSDGTRLAVGTKSNDGAGGSAGHARVFEQVSDRRLSAASVPILVDDISCTTGDALLKFERVAGTDDLTFALRHQEVCLCLAETSSGAARLRC